MSPLYEKLRADVVSAMKARDNPTVLALRTADAAIQRAAMDQSKPIDDALVTATLRKAVKNLADAKAEFQKGGRTDLVSANEAEIALLEKYLPQGLDAARLEALVAAAILSTGAQGRKEMGKVIGALKQTPEAPLIDFAQASRLVQAKLLSPPTLSGSSDAGPTAPPLNAAGQRRVADILAPALSAVVVLVIYGIIACTAQSELGSRTGKEAYYNRLVDGFLRGHLWLDLAPPAALVNLPDPYDPQANAPLHGQMYQPGRIHDLSYYRGRLYLYFSVVPAVVLFLPFHCLTGAYLSHQEACFLFCGVGFLASAALADSIRRHCFPQAGAGAAAFATLGVGLVPLVPIVLQRPDVWEVAITASYAFWMLSLLLIWKGVRRPDPSWAILLGTGVTAGLAIGCRPNEILGAAILFLPLRRCLGRVRFKVGAVAAVLILPLAAIGAGLLAYNYARFGNVFEFGQRYQLSQEGQAESVVRHFDPGFLWYNFRLYFLEYPGWQAAFPFVRNAPHPSMPAGHGIVENPIGVLLLLPFLWCAAAVPWGRRRLEEGPRRRLTPLLGALVVLFLAGAGPICLYFTTCARYQLEFLPALALLAAVGFLAIASAGGVGRPVLQGLFGASGCAAVVSIAFNLLTATNLRGDADAWHGFILMRSGQYDQAVAWYRHSQRLQPANVIAQLGVAESLEREEKFAEASVEFQKAIVLLPNSPEQHLNYAYCLYRLRRWDEAVAECEAALKLRPDFASARNAEQAIRRAQLGGL